jgi:FAD/FMN-containing dehydrogenase
VSEFGRLRDAVHGLVLVPSDAGFDEECRGFNLALEQHPDVVVAATSEADVQAAVQFAAAEGLTIHVQSTGHGSGIRCDGGLLVSTRRMKAVSIDAVNRRARVGAGVRWREIIDAAAMHGLAPLNGSSVDVGVVGYTLGGGMGLMGRTFGFAADHVVRIRLVTAEGDALDVTAESEPELFWALRGGKCDVGIVTELEFELMTVSQYYGGNLVFPAAAARDVLEAFRVWVPTLPEQSSASVALLRLPDAPEVAEPLRGRLSVHVRFVHVGGARDGALLFAQLRAAATPIFDRVALTPYAQIGSVHDDPSEPMPAWDRSTLLAELPEDAVEAILRVAWPGVESPLAMVELRHLGGALARPATVPNAVGGRDAAFSLVVIGPFPPPLRDAVQKAGAEVLDAVAPWSTGGTQINLQGFATDPSSVQRAWSPDVVDRLLAVKRRWDPTGRFRFGYELEASR